MSLDSSKDFIVDANLNGITDSEIQDVRLVLMPLIVLAKQCFRCMPTFLLIEDQ